MKRIRKLVNDFYRTNYDRVAPNWSALVDEVLGSEKEGERLKIIKKYIPFKKDWRILEVGSGFGTFLSYMSKKRYQMTGIEPDPDCLNIIKERFPNLAQNVKKAKGEKLPFADKSFDMVVSFQVLEHVQDVEVVITECARVLKTGGYLYLAFPNYRSFWEPHYAMVFPVFLGKKIFRQWLRINRRNLEFVDHINFISSSEVIKILKKNFNIIDDGKGLFLKRFSANNVPKWGQTGALTKIANLCIILRMNKIIAKILCLFDMHYPGNITAIKK